MRTGGFFPGEKRPGRKVDQLPPSSAEVKNAWSYTSTSPYVLRALCFFKRKDNFILPTSENVEKIRFGFHIK
jgi:hypothetical protein